MRDVPSRVVVPIGRLCGETIVSMEAEPDGPDGWACIRTASGLSLYVDAPTVYADACRNRCGNAAAAGDADYCDDCAAENAGRTAEHERQKAATPPWNLDAELGL